MVARWQALGRESDVEIYRANHHGSKYSSSVELLKALDPEIVLYSAEKGHKHPNPDTVLRSYETARQIATNVDMQQWKRASNFEKMNGEIAGEIDILVAPDGAEFELNGKRFKSYSDVDEANDIDLYSEL
jgi:competence protein ComEC